MSVRRDTRVFRFSRVPEFQVRARYSIRDTLSNLNHGEHPHAMCDRFVYAQNRYIGSFKKHVRINCFCQEESQRSRHAK